MIKTPYSRLFCFGASILLACSAPLLHAERTTVSLDGSWRIADSLSPTEMPTQFTHTVPVPGLANLSRPAFDKVDAFYSREQLANRIRSKLSPAEWLTNYWKGKV